MPDWGQGLQGAAGGAAAGAAFGPWGAGIGAGIGGLAGLFGSSGGPDMSAYEAQLKQLAAGYGQRTAPQGRAQYGENSAFRQNQAGLISQLEAMGRGQGPSAATMQMRDAMDRAAGAQASAAAGAGGRGVNAGAALRNATNNTAAIQSQGARDTMMMRAQEQMAALGQLGQVTAQGRAGDENMSQFNAAQGNAMTQANMQATLQQLGLNDEAQLRALIAAMGGQQTVQANPLGSQILAGGASAAPALMQWQQARNQRRPGQGGPMQPGAPGTGPSGPANFGEGYQPNGSGLGSGHQTPWGY